jgi:hypothetical protein
VLAALAGACAGVAWLHPRVPIVPGAAPILAVMLPDLLFAGFFGNYSKAPLTSFRLVLAAPLAVWS